MVNKPTQDVRLDRIITRQEIPDGMGTVTLTYDGEVVGSITAGTYRRVSDTELQIAHEGANGVNIPTGTSPQGVVLTGGHYDIYGAYRPFTLEYQAADIAAFARVNSRYWMLTLQGGAVLWDVPSALMGVALTSGATEVTVEYWARREDFSAEDFIHATDRSVLVTKDVRFTVRPHAAWQEGSYFTDDLGVRRRVEGVSQLGRSRFIEVLGRSFD